MRATHTATVLSLAILAGCSAQPKAFYQTPPMHGEKLMDGTNYEGDWDGLPKFTLAKSQLVVDFKDKEKKTTPEMISVPTEAQLESDSRTRFMLRQDDAFGIDTHLKVTKIDNTDLLSSVGTEVEDKRVKYIEAAGTLAVSLIGALALNADSELPISIDSYQVLRDGEIKRKADTAYAKITSPDQSKTIHFQANFGPVKDDAIDNLVFAKRANEKAQETIFHSACRNVTVLFNDGPLAGEQFSATVADPRYIQTIRFPEKGSVNFHSACGANTTSLSSGTSSTLDIVNAVIAQSKSVREAWKTSISSKKANENAAAALAHAKAKAAALRAAGGN
ncbi:hypothetical protein PS925_01362 [Pseudomonas fluorescens]|uniref:Lipoprotein n=1 Tax=Pseudomonas fluorescens TaxID=294 RepID=A0A5E7HI52_PSEFL|nr:hypothetical protein [Pseudomonas fluorescens]VVO63665.1 hypothetical protein PS847_00934 [Pseudomonas fluorescens]VVP90749.1 hypothetical protein PS925_01362 [Pseudomonas fluorescens]